MSSEEYPAPSKNVTDLDIYRAAKLMVDYFGNEAAIRTALRADHFYANGDVEGFKTWCRILSAVKILLRIPTAEEIQ